MTPDIVLQRKCAGVAAILLGFLTAFLPMDGQAGAFTAGQVTTGEVRPQRGWAGSPPAAEEWKPEPRPKLAEQIESAPMLRLQEIAPGPRHVWTEKPLFAPNPDGETWDMILTYQSGYMGPKQMVIHDFGTGRTQVQKLCELDDMDAAKKGENFLHTARFSLHLRPHYFAAGKLFVDNSSYCTTWSAYDPAQNRFVWAAAPFGYRDGLKQGASALGEDGMIYGIGWPQDRSCFVPYRLNPETCEVTRYPEFGPANENRSGLYLSSAVDGDWFYAEIGQEPWHLVAFNVWTGEGRLLAESKKIREDQMNLASMKGGVRGEVRNAVFVRGVKDFDRDKFTFWLDNGKVYPREGEIPPWSDKPAELREKQYDWDHNCWFMGPMAHWGDFVPEPGPPEIDFAKPDGSQVPDGNGKVALRWRPRDSEEWRTMNYRVELYPGKVRRLTEINNRVLCALDEGYGEHVFYDVKSGGITRIGATSSPKSMGVAGDRLYVSGYPTSQMHEYDFSRPLGLRQEKPNPGFLGYVGKHNDTHYPIAGTIGGADGRVYSAGCTLGRRRVGGGLGWYDPDTGELGGVTLEGHRVFWMTEALDGRYLILSTKHSGDGRLLCWDTRSHEFIYRKKVRDATRPGPIAEAWPGLMIGHTVHADGGGFLYGFRAGTGEILWTRDVPVAPVTAFSRVRRHAYCFRRGPQGAIWTFFGDTLVRIHPDGMRIEVVGRLPQGHDQAMLAFAGGRVYLAGSEKLMAVKELRVDTK